MGFNKGIMGYNHIQREGNEGIKHVECTDTCKGIPQV